MTTRSSALLGIAASWMWACGGGGTGGPGPSCTTAGGFCLTASTCCSGLVCNTASTCAAPGACGQVSDTCSKSTDCCTPLACTAGKCSTAISCGQTGDTCARDADCCTPGLCTSGKCAAADQRKPFGGSCSISGDCKTNVCLAYQGSPGGYCSEACTRSTTCAAESANPQYWCVDGGQGTSFCMRSCTKSTDCKVIGAQWSCDWGVDLEHLSHGLCGIFTDLGEGFACKDNAQCASGACNGHWCSSTCLSDASCGDYARCMLTTDNSYLCYPNCNVDGDCLRFGPGFSCQEFVSRDGRLVNICAL